MQIRFTPNKLILFLMIIFPISTIYQGIGIFENLNRLIVFGLMGLMVASFFVESIRQIDFWWLVFGIILSVVCIVLTDGMPYFINCYVFFPFWVVFLVYITKNYEYIMEKTCEGTRLLQVVIIIWEVTVFISFFFKRCYVAEWGDVYFQSFSSAPHRFASTCLIIMAYAFILYLVTSKSLYLLHLVLPMVGLFVGGARTYLAIGIVFLFAMFYIWCPKKKYFYISFVPLLLLLVLIISVTPIATKIKNTLAGNGYYGYWATLTNGRSIFWVEDLIGYWNLSPIKKLVGNGANFVYDLNIAGTAGRKLWAHNDFINLLCSNGLLGLLLYFATFFSFVSSKMKKYKGSFIPMFAFYFICGFNAFFNMLYSYTSAVIGIPYILFALYTLPNEIERYKESKEKNS